MRRFALLTLLAFGALVGTALPAHADDDKVRGGKPIAAKARQDFLSALTDAERTYLRKNVKGWETLPPEKQQRMAQNVIRMRTMTEAEKSRLQGHIKRLKRQRGPGGSSDRRPSRRWASACRSRPRGRFP